MDIKQQIRHAVRVAKVRAEAQVLVSALAEAVRNGDDDVAEILAKQLRAALRA